MADNREAPQDALSPALGCLLAPVLVPVLLVFKSYDAIDRGFVVATLLAVFTTVVIQRQDIATEDYFIAIVPPLFLAQLVAAMTVPLPSWNLAGILLTPLAVGALVLNHYVISLAEKYLSRSNS